MKEKPILMSGPMVRAILDGRKTMTRRTLKLDGYDGDPLYETKDGVLHGINELCPYGRVGDRLWVRETFMPMPHLNARAFYRATDPLVGGKWKPSIFMPRWASRITLEITDVRVERINCLSEKDCHLEGVDNIVTFMLLWDKLNARKGHEWKNNEWVWVVEFKRV